MSEQIHFGHILKQARKKAGFSQKDLALTLHVTRNTVINWEADRFRPDHDLIPSLCRLLSLTPDVLFGFRVNEGSEAGERGLLADYRTLSPSGRRMARGLIHILSEEEKLRQETLYKESYTILSLPDTRAAAGTGSPFSDTEDGYCFLKKNDQSIRADAIIGIRGDSMLPVYHDGDYVYVEFTSHAAPGEDVVCSTADGAVIKRVTADHRLASVNPLLPFGDKHEDDHVRIMGRVLGIVSSSDRPTDEESDILEELFADEIRRRF
ncbi:MAG: helix-turn-helix transcriptional regulator [Oscillospiraceae bacterium]|nr:helix-turn-helix transcriptional regulator [Oscillospiraceae bacterium]